MTTAIKVGIFMTIALAVLAVLIFKVEDLRLFQPEGQRVEAAFDSVAGLDDKAPVRVAGVRVGRVDGIRLQGGKALASLLLETPVELTEGASAAIANVGMLGDKYVELLLGPADAPPLAAGTVLPGTTPVSFDDALAKLDDLAGSIGGVVDSVAAEGPGVTVARLLDNLEATSADIRALVSANRAQVGATVANFERFSATLAAELPRLTDQMTRVLEQVEAVVAENRGSLRDGLAGVSEVTERIQVSIDHLNEISGRIASGEGTIGKLVQSDEAHDSLVGTLGSIQTGVDSLSETFGKLQKIQLDLGFDSYYLEETRDSRTAFNVTVDPGSNRFYYLELVDDPRGRVRSQTEEVTVTGPDGVAETTTTRRVTTEDDTTISAQFGFRVGDASLRAGLFEATGGAAIDYGLFGRRLVLSMEAFDFGRENDLDPRLRFTTRWRLHPNVFILAGLDDLLEEERESVFFGAGVRWSDDDLKYLLGSVPRF